MRGGIAKLAMEEQSAVKAWPCDEEKCYMTYLPLRGCITT
jgi:hypothetical protein